MGTGGLKNVVRPVDADFLRKNPKELKDNISLLFFSCRSVLLIPRRSPSNLYALLVLITKNE
jgi:hypothetical protein